MRTNEVKNAMDKNDIIIELAEYLKKDGKDEIIIDYDALEAELLIPKDSIATYLAEAADEADYEIVRPGERKVSLRKKSPPTTVELFRG